MNKAIAYTRVSSDEQRKEGYSLDYQTKTIKEYARKNNLNIVEFFSESMSAKLPGRIEFNKMLKYAQINKIDNILFLKNDRASRNEVDSGWLIHLATTSNIKVHLIKDGLILHKKSLPQDFLIFSISSAVSSMFPRNLSEEVKSKKLEKAQQGYYPARPPVGYITKRINKKAHIEPDPEKSPYIKKIFELYSTGIYSYQTIAKILTKDGFMISKTNKCTKRNIEIILNNPIYMGAFVWNGQTYYNAKHEPIVSEELYLSCQNIMKNKNGEKKNKHSFLFSGIAKCEKCGCNLVGEIKKGKYIYYHCTGNKGGDCKRNYIREEILEEQFIQFLQKLAPLKAMTPMILTKVKELLNEELEYNENKIKQNQKKIEQTKKRLNNLLMLKLDETISDELYTLKQKELTEELNDLLLENTTKQLNTNTILENAKFTLELFTKAPQLYLSQSTEEKHKFIKMLCSNFFYDGQNIIIEPIAPIIPLLNLSKIKKSERKGFEPSVELLPHNLSKIAP